MTTITAPPQCFDNVDNEGASCWLCLGEGPDESGRPLVRDCSCRGESAGFGHLSCLVAYAQQKTEQWDGCDGNKFLEPWTICPSCRQAYQNELAFDLATKFVTSMKGKYPDDQSKQLTALSRQLHTLLRIAIQPKQTEAAKEIANEILFMIGGMKTPNSSLPPSIIQLEVATFNDLGRISLREGTKESVKSAIEYFEKLRDISKDMGFVDEVIVAERNIVVAKSKRDGSTTPENEEEIEEEIEKWQECYTKRVEKFGDTNFLTVEAGLNLANELRKALRAIEAGRLLTKLADTCKQVHGPDHGLTKKTEATLEAGKIQNVGMMWYVAKKYQHEHDWKLFEGIYFQKWTYFQALRYEDDGEKCVLRGPIASSFIWDCTPRNISSQKTFTVASKDIHILVGTPVVCHELSISTHLDGKIGDVRSVGGGLDLFKVKVHFEDSDLEPCLIKRDNVRILFDLPDE